MASPHIERNYNGPGTYRLCWRLDGQTDYADKVVRSAEELEEVCDRWTRMGYHIISINKVVPE